MISKEIKDYYIVKRKFYMEKKRLLITASTFPRWENDTEPRFILDYAKEMTKYYEVHVLVPMAPGAKREECMEGVRVHRFHYFFLHNFETLCYPGAIVPRIKENKARILLVPFLLFAMKINCKRWSKKIDIVHAHWIIPQGIIQSTIKNVPYLVTGHGGDVTSLNYYPIKWIKKKCLRKAFATVGVSNYICEKMRNIDETSCPTMISMGCDTTTFSPHKKIEDYFDTERKVVLFVGRLAEKKGVKYLIEAMKEVDAVLYIVGEGPLGMELREQAKSYEDKVKFLGAKSHEELPVIMASADLFVAPSIVATNGDQEGLPVSIMEALASGLPVVAGNSGGTKDIIENGVNGFVVDAKNVEQLTDKINQIIKNDILLKKMGENSVKTAKKYSYKIIGEKYHELIQEKLYSK